MRRSLSEPERMIMFPALFSPSDKQAVLRVVRICGGYGVVCMAPVFQSDADLLYPLILPSMWHRIDKQISRFRRWLPKKPMRLDKETLPDLEENDCYTAPFSQQRIHQWVICGKASTLLRMDSMTEPLPCGRDNVGAILLEPLSMFFLYQLRAGAVTSILPPQVA